VTGFLECSRRQLTAAEIRLLRARASSLRGRGPRIFSRGTWVGAITIAVLWGLTVVASDAPIIVVTAFWIVAGAFLLWWVRRDLTGHRRMFDAVAEGLESALRRNLAEVCEVRASGFVEFAETEDEGACYAFQLSGRNEVVFLSGQEFYEEARFPSLDFALVFPLDEADGRVDMVIERRGAKAKPERVVPASVKRTLTIPPDLQILDGPLQGIENRFAPDHGNPLQSKL
jgi:hypothetical protein